MRKLVLMRALLISLMASIGCAEGSPGAEGLSGAAAGSGGGGVGGASTTSSSGHASSASGHATHPTSTATGPAGSCSRWGWESSPLACHSEGSCCALLSDGAVKCWGYNAQGQLGLGDKNSRGNEPGEMGDALPFVDLGTGRTAIQLTAGATQTCALLDDHSVKCWGGNVFGELGIGDTQNRGDDAGEMGDALPTVDLGTGRTAVTIAAGAGHICALLDDATLKCWGWGPALGLGDTDNRGDEPGEMGDALPTVDLGTGRTVVTLAPGLGHTCAILDDGTVRCWGTGDTAYGQLGLGDATNHGDEPGEMGDALPALDLGAGRSPVALAAGYAHTCALFDDGAVKCWGAAGLLGLGVSDDNRGDEPGEMGDALSAIDLGSGRTACAFTAGETHTCARLDDSTLKCWGNNDYGTLGLGDTELRGDNAGEMGDALPVVDLGTGRTAVALSAGQQANCALCDNGDIKCWGENFSGELGLGDTNHRGDAPGEMGEALPAVPLQ